MKDITNGDNTIISVFVPVYNCESSIERTLNSVIRQMDQDVELVIINDGSKDNTISVINDIIKECVDNKIKVISKENAGVSSARQDGFNIATGEYVVSVDAGDELSDNAISVIKREIKKYPDVDYFLMNSVTNDKGNIKYRRYDWCDLNGSINLLIGKCPFSVCFKVIRRSLMLDCNVAKYRPKITNGDDLCFSFYLMNKTSNGRHIDEYLYIYNKDENSLSSSSIQSKEFLKSLDYIFDEIQCNNYDLLEAYNYLVFTKTVMDIVLNKVNEFSSALFAYYSNKHINLNNKHIRYGRLCVIIAKIKLILGI